MMKLSKVANTFFLLSALVSAEVLSNETCSRVAQINFQNVLVDTNSSEKGEGLRYHLEKDPLALNYLNIYQENTKIQWQNAALGTVGTGLLLAGVFTNSNKVTKKNLIISGGVLVIINFLVAKTLEKSNEKNLIKAIDEYNKRNLPRIYFSPGLKNSTNRVDDDATFYLEKNWDF